MQVDLGRLDVQIYPFVGNENFAKANIVIYIDKESDALTIHINTNNVFEALLYRLEVAGALNKKLDELVQKHLAKEADKQKVIEAGR